MLPEQQQKIRHLRYRKSANIINIVVHFNRYTDLADIYRILFQLCPTQQMLQLCTYNLVRFFFLKYAGELRIIASREEELG